MLANLQKYIGNTQIQNADCQIEIRSEGVKSSFQTQQSIPLKGGKRSLRQKS
jgi:hypothetical protein